MVRVMLRVSELSGPTMFDHPVGEFPQIADGGYGSWYVAPVTQTRDSGALTRSNFRVCLARLGGERDGRVEVHRFGHWGPGWYEHIFVSPHAGAEVIGELARIADSLSDYPVLNEEDWSDLEWTEAMEYWSGMDLRSRARLCAESGESIFAARRNVPPDRVYERLTRDWG